MAWLMETKATKKCSPVIHRSNDWLNAFKLLNEYGQKNPQLFSIPTNFTRHGVFLPRETLPDSASAECTFSELPDVLGVGEIAVSQRLMDIIQRIEPNTHQFHHLPVSCLKGSPCTADYFILIAGHAAFDQVDMQASTIGKKTGIRGTKVVVPMVGDDNKIVVDRAVSPNWHLWWSWDIYGYLTISNELKRELKGIPCLEFIELAEKANEQVVA